MVVLTLVITGMGEESKMVRKVPSDVASLILWNKVAEPHASCLSLCHSSLPALPRKRKRQVLRWLSEFRKEQ